MTTETELSYGGRLVKAGRTHDMEDSRMTARLQLANQIMRGMGIERHDPEHDPKCIKHPANAGNRCFGYTYRCDAGCGFTSAKVTWSEWVTDAIFNQVFTLADTMQVDRAAWMRRAPVPTA